MWTVQTFHTLIRCVIEAGPQYLGDVSSYGTATLLPPAA
jgi:hypothetical protein